MDPELQKRVQERLAELPADVRAAVQSAELAKKVAAIGQKHALHIDQMGSLENEVYLVMLGFADPGEFVAQLETEMSIPPQKAVEIATDVANEIFMPVRESMKVWAEERSASESARLVTETLGKQEPVEPPRAVPIRPASPPPPAPAPIQTAPTPPTPAHDLEAADALLAGKKPDAPKPYKADPYRESVE